jgi:hypothetical protein
LQSFSVLPDLYLFVKNPSLFIKLWENNPVEVAHSDRDSELIREITKLFISRIICRWVKLPSLPNKVSRATCQVFKGKEVTYDLRLSAPSRLVPF